MINPPDGCEIPVCECDLLLHLDICVSNTAIACSLARCINVPVTVSECAFPVASDKTAQIAKEASGKGYRVIIAGAGLAGANLTLPDGKVNVELHSAGGLAGLGTNVHSYVAGDAIRVPAAPAGAR